MCCGTHSKVQNTVDYHKKGIYAIIVSISLFNFMSKFIFRLNQDSFFNMSNLALRQRASAGMAGQKFGIFVMVPLCPAQTGFYFERAHHGP